jgi:hypothetical protein
LEEWKILEFVYSYQAKALIFQCSNLTLLQFLMTTKETFTDLALSFSNTEQTAHFERIGFKVIGKRMYATYLERDNTANVFLSVAEQKVFCRIDKKNIYPVPNKWGEKGATTLVLDNLSTEIISEALLSAYNEVVKPKKGKG